MGRNLSRFEGRLFVEGGVLFYVVEADHEAGTARVCGRIGGESQVVDMHIDDVARHLSSGSELKLDNINGPGAAKRVVERDGQWFFQSREGLKGPFPTDSATRAHLARYILTMQSPGAPQSRAA